MKAAGYVCLCGVLFAAAQAHGQFSGTQSRDASDVKGQIVGAGNARFTGLAVELTGLTERNNQARTDVMSDGSFTFHFIPAGQYQVRVANIYGEEIFMCAVQVGPFTPPIEIRLDEGHPQRPISGTVSIHELNHPMSKQVKKLLESGEKFAHDGHFDDATSRFREAVKDDPQCSQAHEELALALSRTGSQQNALEEYRAAVSLDPGNSVLHSNLGAALATSGKFDEAQSEASAALQLDSRNARAHFILAGALLQKPGHYREALPHLAAAQDVFPTARKAIEQICSKGTIAGCP